MPPTTRTPRSPGTRATRTGTPTPGRGPTPSRAASTLDFDQIEGEIEERRAAYWSQPLIAALSKDNLLPWQGTIRDTYGVTREEFTTRAGREAPTTYALVAEGAWKGRGRMGWFGMSSDEVPHDEWVDFWWRMVDGLPDDTLLSVYDLHI